MNACHMAASEIQTVKLCMLACKVVELVRQSLNMSPFDITPLPKTPLNAKGSAAVQKQPRRRVVPPIVPEYKQLRTIATDDRPPVDGKRKLTRAFHGNPAGSKLVAPFTVGKDVGNKLGQVHQLTFGKYHSPMEFISVALKQPHPFMFSMPCLIKGSK